MIYRGRAAQEIKPFDRCFLIRHILAYNRTVCGIQFVGRASSCCRTASAFNREKKIMSKSIFKNTTKPVAPEEAAKPSNAEYPVGQADLVSQRQRLRKAAAAGVDALKSPTSSLMSPPSSPPAAMPQKPLEPLAALPQSSSAIETTPKPSQAPFPVIPAAPSGEIDRSVPLVVSAHRMPKSRRSWTGAC